MASTSFAEFDFSEDELNLLKSLNGPEGIKKFLDEFDYHKGDTAWSPRLVMRERKAHCLEGALLASAALRVNGYAPLIVDLEAERDTDHVIAVYKEAGAWGAIAASSFAGLRHRAPVYRSLRELALSYFENYFNFRGELCLRRFSRPVNLSRFDHLGWMTSEKSLWYIVDHLFEIPHTELLTDEMIQNLKRVDSRTFKVGTWDLKE